MSKNQFIFGEPDIHGDITVAYKFEGEERNTHLGKIRPAEYGKLDGKWSISEICQFDRNSPRDLRYLPLQGKIEAANALRAIYQGIEANPLPEKVHDFIVRESDRLRDQRKALLAMLSDVEFKRLFLLSLGKEYKIEGVVYANQTADMANEVKDLTKFLDEHYDDLYKHFGKDFARSLRGLISSIVRLVDPNAAELI